MGELAPLSHKVDADRVVLSHAKKAELECTHLLDEARTLAAEVRSDQQEATPEDVERVRNGDKRSLLIGSARARAADQQQTCENVRTAVAEAETALVAAATELRGKEEILERERHAFRAEIEALLKEEGEDLSEEEIANLVSSENDSPVLQDLQQQISIVRAVHDDLQRQAEEKRATLAAAHAASETTAQELTALEEEEKNAEMPALTAYFLNHEVGVVRDLVKLHEETRSEVQDAQRKSKEQWASEKARLQEELHEASVSVEVAKANLESVQSMGKALKH